MIKEILTIALLLLFCSGIASAALIVPNEIMQHGTQPREVTNLEMPDKCDNCHGLYDPVVEPAHNWRGSMMANAGRDPIFWGTLAVAEQDFDRCRGSVHTMPQHGRMDGRTVYPHGWIWPDGR